jgi:hypothetical protein
MVLTKNLLEKKRMYILVHVGELMFHVDFVLMETKESSECQLILGRPFLEVRTIKSID